MGCNRFKIPIIQSSIQTQLHLAKNNKMCWLKDILNIFSEVDITLSLNKIKQMKKEEWKSLINNKIKIKAFTELQEEKTTKKKLNQLTYNIDHWKIKEYFCQYTSHQSSLIYKVRTRMLPVKGNFCSSNQLDKTICPLCRNNNDTQHHIFTCKHYKPLLVYEQLFLETSQNLNLISRLDEYKQNNNK